jgi:integrase/recombinase XerD
MASVLVLGYDDERIVEDYLAAMRAGGAQTGRSTTQAAHSCQAKIRRAGGWRALGAAEQADAVTKARSYTSWLMATGRITVDAALLSRTDLRPGIPARRLCPEDYRWFSETCSRIGVPSPDKAAQWNLLVKITAIIGVALGH